MNNLLFTTLLLALLYYFFYYLPQQKKLTNPNPTTKLTHSQFTQTDEYEPGPSDTLNCPGPESIPDPEAIKNLQKDIQQKERTIIGLNNSCQKLETKTNQEIDKLKEQLKTKDQKLTELSETEKTVDHLIKNIQDFQKELD